MLRQELGIKRPSTQTRKNTIHVNCVHINSGTGGGIGVKKPLYSLHIPTAERLKYELGPLTKTN